MVLRRSIQMRGDRAIALVDGEYDLKSATDLFAKILAESAEAGASEILIDYRAMTGRMFATEKVLFGHKAGEVYQTHHRESHRVIRIAFLGTSQFIQVWKPAMEAMRSLGMDCLMTTSESDASIWLDQDSLSLPHE